MLSILTKSRMGGVDRAKMEAELLLKGSKKQCIRVFIQIILEKKTGGGGEEVDN